MAGTTASSIVSLSYNSSTPKQVQWVAIATDAGRHIDVSGVNATKMILLVLGDSTDQSVDYLEIGNTDSDASSTAPFSAGKLGQMKLGTTIVVKASAYAKIIATASTHLKYLSVMGPFETARFQDSDGYINVSKTKTGSSDTYICPVLLP